MENTKSFVTHRQRWLVLLTVTLFNVSNNILWISYSAVAEEAAQYFDKDVNQIDLLATISFYVGIPMCIAVTWIVDTWGLRTGMFLGTLLTTAGAIVRGLSTAPGLNDKMSLDLQFTLSVVGQALTGLGNPLAVSVPTKVSQNWFPESERLLATGILAMSLPLGIVLGQGVTPTFIKNPTDIPLMNLVWLAPAILTQLCCFLFVRSSNPPTPPSQSALLSYGREKKSLVSYFRDMKKILTNVPYLIIFFGVGGAVGFFNAISTQMSQIMSAVGYTSVFAGACSSLLLATGFVGAIITGVAVEKWGHMIDISKAFFGLAGLSGILALQMMRLQDMQIGIALGCSLFGVFGFGVYPLGLELAVEATYPIDEAIGTAMIFMSGQIQGGILVVASQFLEETTEIEGEEKPRKDHTKFLLLMCGYLTFIVLVYLFLNTKLKRTLANQTKETAENENKVTEL